jgi:O-antigen ligase
LDFFTNADPHGLEARPEPRIFWPAMAAISVVFAVPNRSRLTFPPHIISLFAYLAFAGASVLWAFSSDRSLVRYFQQVMVVTSIVLPAMLASREVDILRGLLFVFALALILNLFFVAQGSVAIANNGAGLVDIGYRGYFEGKNYLGECSTLAFLLGFHEMFHRGWRRALGVAVVVIAILLVFLSQSKTAFGLALLSPLLAWLTLLARRLTRVSPAVLLLLIPVCWKLLSSVSNFGFARLSYILYGDSTLTGREIIWDFAQYEIGRSPLIGWGYQSFWLVPNSPSADAPGWVNMMPNAHNGYYDTILETGYVGFAFLLVFIIATLHAVGRVADHDRPRAQLLLSLALFIILFNFFESVWMRGFEFLWVVFVIVAAEIGRYGRRGPLRRAYKSSIQRPNCLAPSPRVRLSPP